MTIRGLLQSIRYAMLLTLLLPICAGCSRRSERVETKYPNILLVLVDALRADHLIGYGYDRQTSPFLDEFGHSGVRFSQAYSHSSHTKISVASLFTGLIPPSHQVRKASFRDTADKTRSDVLGDSVDTLAEILRRHGYSTAGFVTNPHLQSFQGFSQGFDEYQYYRSKSINADLLNKKATSWLESHNHSPFFLYMHYMDVHAPYDPPPAYRQLYGKEKKSIKPISKNGPLSEEIDQETIDYSIALYDAQINFWDECFQEFVTTLDGHGWLQDTIVVIVSDHGDEFGDHGGSGHGYTVYTEMIQVPLYFVFRGKLPGGVVRHDPARLIDVFPTLCGLAGIPTDGMNLEGVDLFGQESTQTDASRVVYSETYRGKKPRSVRTTDRHLIFNAELQTWEFYDLRSDFDERSNNYRENSNEIADLARVLYEFMEGKDVGPRPESVELDKDTIQELRSLGYVE